MKRMKQSSQSTLQNILNCVNLPSGPMKLLKVMLENHIKDLRWHLETIVAHRLSNFVYDNTNVLCDYI